MKPVNQINLDGWLPLRGRWLHYFLLGLAYLVSVPLLLAAAWPRFFEPRIRTRIGTTYTQIRHYETALAHYCADHGGRPPTTTQGLAALIRQSPSEREGKWQGPYLSDITSVPPDEWGYPYHYQSPGPDGEAYVITSYGADGYPGGSGDDEDLFSRHSPPWSREGKP